ncbi:hypothetical protein [Leucobacter sp.]
MTEQVMVAIVGLAGVITTAIATVLVAMIQHQRRELKAVKDQVTNSHILPNGQPYNLRDNIDHNQAAVMAEFRGMRRDLGRLEARVFRTEEKLDRVDEKQDEVAEKLGAHLAWSTGWSPEQERRDAALEQRVTNIEDTLNPKEKP